MTTVPPPTTPPLPAAPPAQAAPVLLILAPPAAVASLPAGAALGGVVLPPPPQPPTDTASDARNVVTVRTPQGDVTLRLPVPLPPGSGVELQVVRASPDQATLRLMAVNDQPAAQVLAQLRQAATTNTPIPQPPAQTPPPATAAPLPPASAWTPQGPVALPALGTLSAYVIQGAPAAQTSALPQPAPGMPAAPPTFALSTGGELAVRVAAVQLPPGETPTTPSATAVTTPAPATPIVTPAPAATAVAVTVGQTTLPAPAPLTQSPAAVTQPTPPPPAPAIAPIIATGTPPVPLPAVIVAGPEGLPPPPPTPPAVTQGEPPQAVFTGIVVRSPPGSPPVIATDLGDIQLNVRANLPVGARVTLQVMTQLPPQPGAAPPPLPITALPLSGPPSGGTTVGWPNVSEALVQLTRADPAVAAQFAEAIPDGGPRTTVGLMQGVHRSTLDCTVSCLHALCGVAKRA